MQPDIATTHRHLGELAVMSHKVTETERRILARGQELLKAAQDAMDESRAAALAGDADASRRYQDAVAERGRCEMVIAQARKNLGG